MSKKRLMARYFYRHETLMDLSSTDIECTWKRNHENPAKNYEVAAPLMHHSCFIDLTSKRLKLDSGKKMK